MPFPAQIELALAREAVVLTGNSRAARQLHLQFAHRQRELGRDTWPSPAIHDWSAWLNQLWQEHSFQDPGAPLRLTPLQERTLWQRAQREDALLVVSPESMAALAAQAYALLCAYDTHASRARVWDESDAERFRRWAAAFDQECNRHGWLSAARVEERLIAGLTEGRLSPPPEILLLGFDRLTPLQRKLLAACQAHGSRCEELQPTGPPQPIQLPRTTSARDEITACAWWARDLLLTAPQSRIAVIVPDVEASRGEIARIFRRVLAPETENILLPAASLPFEFSLGESLAQAPVVRAALLLLKWLDSPLREEELSWLLLSGFLDGSEEDTIQAAQFDASLRASGSLSLEIPLDFLCRKLRAERAAPLQALRTRLEKLQQTASANTVMEQDRRPGAWAEIARLLLETAGWPGSRSPDSVQFQAQQRWERLLDEVAALDFDGSSMSYASFLAHLQSHAAETVFAAESQQAPIQIMGPLESAGQQFDAVWFLGATDRNWPMRGRAHPLLPLSAQKLSGMPHAAPETDWELARQITERLRVSAAEIVVSCAERDKDGELRLSPLIASASALEPLADPTPSGSEERTATLDLIIDLTEPIPWPPEQVAGGAGLLKNQAACPFRAFAAKRLQAEALNRADWGLSAAERGELLHDVLKRFWSSDDDIRTRDDLRELIETDRLHAKLRRHIADAFAKLSTEHGEDAWMRAYLASEQHRLAVRLAEWFQCEAQREPFTVEAREQAMKNIGVGDLRLNLRADRIDLLPNGSHFLIDYKTGEVSPAAWEGERLDEPQLPLYAIYGGVENVSGVLFGQIRAGKTKFLGRVRDAKTQLDRNLHSANALISKPYNDQMRAGWANSLLHLAEDFLAGEAAVDPKKGRETCAYCELPGLCRIGELARKDAAEDADAEEGGSDD